MQVSRICVFNRISIVSSKFEISPERKIGQFFKVSGVYPMKLKNLLITVKIDFSVVNCVTNALKCLWQW